jgi:hypothetical protein
MSPIMSTAMNIALTILLGMLIPFCGCYFTSTGSIITLILTTMLAIAMTGALTEEYGPFMMPYLKLWWMVYIIGIMVNVVVHS